MHSCAHRWRCLCVDVLLPGNARAQSAFWLGVTWLTGRLAWLGLAQQPRDLVAMHSSTRPHAPTVPCLTQPQTAKKRKSSKSAGGSAKRRRGKGAAVEEAEEAEITAAAAEESDDESDREAVDWEAHPAVSILGKTAHGKVCGGAAANRCIRPCQSVPVAWMCLPAPLRVCWVCVHCSCLGRSEVHCVPALQSLTFTARSPILNVHAYFAPARSRMQYLVYRAELGLHEYGLVDAKVGHWVGIVDSSPN